MRRIREVLRLKYECGLSNRCMSASTGMSKGSVSEYLRRARDAGMTWEQACALDDGELERRLFHAVGYNEPSEREPIDLEWAHLEMRKAGVTLQLVWAEYFAAVKAGDGPKRPYQYSQFCELYRRYEAKVDVVMRQSHRAGERLFIDYSGKRPVVWNRETGEAEEVELYVAVLGASNYTYVEATRTQQLADFVMSTVRALEYFGATPEILVPDQLRSAVSGPHRHDPVLNPTYAEMAAHYGTAVIPARPGKPRDKAKVEGGVLIAQRWILACLRNRKFYSLDELNEAIDELLERLNNRPFARLDGCRRSVFETLERPAMRPLPATRYQLAAWKTARVNIDYHVEYEGRFYSVANQLVGKSVEIRATTATIEILHAGRRVAGHARSYGPKGSAVTDPSHRPKSHQQYGDWPPSRVLGWAENLGPSVGAVAQKILEAKRHPEMGYRSCLALIADVKRYDVGRVEAACRRALEIGAPTRQSVLAILRNGLDRIVVEPPPSRPPVPHELIRGGDYYDKKEMETDDDLN